jgi:hypothetical protein
MEQFEEKQIYFISCTKQFNIIRTGCTIWREWKADFIKVFTSIHRKVGKRRSDHKKLEIPTETLKPEQLRNRDSSVGKTTGYGWTARVRFTAEERDVSFLHSVQTGAGAHSASHEMDAGGFSPGVKQLGREAYHSLPSSPEVKSNGAIILFPHTSSWLGV